MAPASPRPRVLVCGDSELERTLAAMDLDFDVLLADGYGAMLPAMDAMSVHAVVVASDGRDAPAALRRARERHPRARLLVVSNPKDHDAVHLLLEGVIDGLLERPVDKAELLHSLLGAQGAHYPRPGEMVNPVIVVGHRGHDAPSIPEILANAELGGIAADTAEAALAAIERNDAIPMCVLDLENSSIDWLTFLMQVASRSRCELLAVGGHELDPRLGGALYRGGDCVSRPVRPDELVRRARRLYDRFAEREERHGNERAAPVAWIASRSPLMRRTLGLIESIAPTEATVCLRGEIGAGKEMLARLLHDWSARASRPFVSVNCGALHDSLLDGELFGQDRDPMTGVVQLRHGLVDLARGGTLFLDEVDQVSPGMQQKLLRLLEDKEFVRIGGVEMFRCDVRVVAASAESLESLVQQGRFDKNLYRWIMQVPMPVPPLRERIDDVPELATFLLRRIAKSYGRPIPRLSPALIPRLLKHEWPGNVAELENALELALTRAVGTELREVELGPRASTWYALTSPGFDTDDTIIDDAAFLDKASLVALLFRHRGSAKAAAATAAIDRRTLYAQLQAFHVDPLGFQNTFE